MGRSTLWLAGLPRPRYLLPCQTMGRPSLAISDYLRDLRKRIGHNLVLMPSVAVMIRDGQGRLLLVRDRDTGLWQTVGGAMDPNEEPADAAVREAFEETGLLVEPTRIIGVYGGPRFCLTYPNGDQVSYVGISFAARVVGGAERLCHDEVDRRAWFDRAAALALPIALHTRQLIEATYRDAPGAAFAPPDWRPGG
jgi:8-oxo-dGTP pyrophosphatase MutT (NUDIX family)